MNARRSALVSPFLLVALAALPVVGSGCAALGLAAAGAGAAQQAAKKGEPPEPTQEARKLGTSRETIDTGAAKITAFTYVGAGTATIWVGSNSDCDGGMEVVQLGPNEAYGEPITLKPGQDLCARERTSSVAGSASYQRLEIVEE